ncbi:MAG: DUF4139 domain-containing protein [Bacteroidota bacterium]
MKHFLTLTLVLLLAIPALRAQDTERAATADISAVTVFQSGAQITRAGKIRLEKGKNILVFRGLATGIDPNSIQVSAPEDILLNSVAHEVNYLHRQGQSPRLTQLSDSLRTVRDLLLTTTNARKVLELEKNMVLANQQLGSTTTGVKVEELQKAADFFRQRLTRIEGDLLDNQTQERDLKTTQQRLNRQYQELNGQRNRPSNDIRVILNTFSAQTVPVTLKYYVTGATWTPKYDLRATNTQAPIQLDYRADVAQQTGIDWSDVQLTLSTGNPSRGGTFPGLSPWQLSIYQPYTLNETVVVGKSRSRAIRAAPRAQDESDKDLASGGLPAEYGDVATLADFTTVNEGATTVEFAISVPQTIPSDAKPQRVDIQRTDLPADFQHVAVPKLDKDAFLLARISEWESLNLLPGEAQIFFEGTYVTSSYIGTGLAKDTLEFSLGRDGKVVIQRAQLKDFTKIRTLGANRTRTFAYEITARNTKSEPVTLRLEDQIPVSQDKDITVKVEELSGAQLNADTGQLTWDLSLAPQTTQKLRLIFSVKHPKNLKISN